MKVVRVLLVRHSDFSVTYGDISALEVLATLHNLPLDGFFAEIWTYIVQWYGQSSLLILVALPFSSSMTFKLFLFNLAISWLQAG